MTKKTKAIRTIAAVTAAALLGGGIYLLVKNDVAQKINWQDILIYAPTPIARETLDEAVNNSSDKPSADRVPEDTKKELTAQVRQLSNEHSDSVAWLYIPGTNIDYPVMQSEDNEYYAHRAADGSYLYAGSLFMDYRCSSDFRTSTALFMVTIWAMERCLQIFRITKTRNISWNTATAG